MSDLTWRQLKDFINTLSNEQLDWSVVVEDIDYIDFQTARRLTYHLVRIGKYAEGEPCVYTYNE